MPCKIHNAGIADVTLPFPLTGILHAGAQVVVDMTEPEVRAILVRKPRDIRLTDLPANYGAAFDAPFIGAAKAGTTMSVPGGLAFGGDIDAAGGFRHLLGPFVRDATAANLTNSRLGIGATGAPQLDQAMPRAGSLTAITLASTVAPAGANLVVSVFKNGTLLDATAILTVVPGAPLGYAVSFAKDNPLLVFVAGDRIGVAVTTPGGWTATTAALSVLVEVEC